MQLVFIEGISLQSYHLSFLTANNISYLLNTTKIYKIINRCSRINHIILDMDIIKSEDAVELLNKCLAGLEVDRIEISNVDAMNEESS